jgi:hypothetical protein
MFLSVPVTLAHMNAFSFTYSVIHFISARVYHIPDSSLSNEVWKRKPWRTYWTTQSP